MAAGLHKEYHGPLSGGIDVPCQKKCDSESDIIDVALAVATTRKHPAPVDIVWVSREKLKADVEDLKDSDGETRVKDMINKHVDVYGLDHNRLCRVANHVVAAISENRYRRLSKCDVRCFLN